MFELRIQVSIAQRVSEQLSAFVDRQTETRHSVICWFHAALIAAASDAASLPRYFVKGTFLR
jgi:hypothetical protein